MSSLAPSELGVLTGEWLEAMACMKGIHPILSRVRIEEAYSDALLNRFYSGATPPHGYDAHALDVLETNQGTPVIKRFNLYAGSFMLTERASVYMRLERTTP